MIIKVKTTTLRAGSFKVVKEVQIVHEKGEKAIAIQIVMPPEHQVPVIEIIHKDAPFFGGEFSNN